MSGVWINNGRGDIDNFSILKFFTADLISKMPSTKMCRHFSSIGMLKELFKVTARCSYVFLNYSFHVTLCHYLINLAPPTVKN